MKRSEVVKLLANWAKPEILDDTYSKNYQEWADNLLHTLEKEVGMLPPTVPTLPIGANVIRSINKWEPEDEENVEDSYWNAAKKRGW
jgi:hypothetical protein